MKSNIIKKFKLDQISNAFVWIIIAYLLFQKSLVWHKEYQQKGQTVQNLQIDFLQKNGDLKRINLFEPGKNKVLLFWATWCGPCKVELSRVQSLFDRKKIDETQFLAISSFEELSTVVNEVKKKNYLFPVAIDPDGAISKQFKIAGTPTIVYLKNGQIESISTGLSLFPSYSIENFLKLSN